MKPLKIYVAGAYSGETEEKILSNVQKAIDAGIQIQQKRHRPYIPHTTYLVDKRATELGISISWEDYMLYHDAWLKVSDAFLYLNSSPGADIELENARKYGLKIYFNVDEIPVAEVEEWK